MRLTEEEYAELKKNLDNNISGKVANRKQNTRNELLGTKKVKGFDRPVDIYYRERRVRLCDSDGAMSKYHTDALVSAGILRDDSTKEIPKSPYKEQEKCKKDEEQTIIIIRER